MLPGYSAHDTARLRPESPKDVEESPKDIEAESAASSARSPFARDRARVLHSAALRRLAGKTQVLGPGEGDVPRTRLTHSLEVAQIGRGIAVGLGADPDVVDTAGLAHDIGHPPFGHNGERALNDVAVRCGGFEGNAQTLRILTRLEPKLIGPDGTGQGLNLTRACLDAATKYPWPKRPGTVKFGVYEDDREAFEWIRADAPGTRRCLEAQIMDWADDLAYSVHDLEDGVHSGRISLRMLTRPDERAEIVRMAAKYFWHDGQPTDPLGLLEHAASALVDIPSVAAMLDYDMSLHAQAGLKRLTSELVGRFANAAVHATLAAGPVQLSRYHAELVVPEWIVAEVSVLKAVAVRYVMSDPERLRMQERQREMLTELVWSLAERAPDSLDPASRGAWSRAEGDAGRLRVVLDQVASLTDTQAVTWHQRYVHGIGV